MGTGSFLGVKSGWGVTLALHHLLVPWSRKSRAIPLLPLWAVQPVQNLSVCVYKGALYLFFHDAKYHSNLKRDNITFSQESFLLNLRFLSFQGMKSTTYIQISILPVWHNLCGY